MRHVLADRAVAPRRRGLEDTFLIGEDDLQAVYLELDVIGELRFVAEPIADELSDALVELPRFFF